MGKRILINWDDLGLNNGSKNEMKQSQKNSDFGVIIGKVYKTTDYSIFKDLTGNRIDALKRVSKIKESAEKVGYLPIPITVNEKMEIIDGQARFEYCKETNKPIAYHIIVGTGMPECIAINSSQTNWKNNDYINAHAKRGNKNYILLRDFLNLSDYPYDTKIWALFHRQRSSKEIRSGEMKLSKATYDKGLEIINFWKRFDDVPTNRLKTFLIALGWCYLMEDVDKEDLDRRIHNNLKSFTMLSNTIDAMEVIESIYNYRRRDHVYIKTEYLKMLETESKVIVNKMKKNEEKAKNTAKRIIEAREKQRKLF